MVRRGLTRTNNARPLTLTWNWDRERQTRQEGAIKTRECEGTRSKGLTRLFCISAGEAEQLKKETSLVPLQPQWEKRERETRVEPMSVKRSKAHRGPHNGACTNACIAGRKERHGVTWGKPRDKTGSQFGRNAQLHFLHRTEMRLSTAALLVGRGRNIGDTGRKCSVERGGRSGRDMRYSVGMDTL